MFLGIDGGGSRLRLLLVDSDLRVIRSVEGAGVNTNFIPASEVHRTMEETVKTCLPEGTELDGVAMMVLGAAPMLEEILRKQAVIGRIQSLSEGEMGLMAGLGQPRGFLALSGTGSDVFFLDGNRREVIGGWGLLLGDEGSGTDIGQMGLRAAIKAHEGWGESTLLLELLLTHWQMHRTDMMRQMCEKVYTASNPRSVVASFARKVADAARMGDSAAVSICRSAGHAMALQMVALIERVSATVEDISAYAITLSGSTWKGSRQMFQSFESHMNATCPKVRICWPAYDPIAGAVASLASACGMNEETLTRQMSKHLGAFRFEKPEDWPIEGG